MENTMKSVAFHNLGCKVNGYEMDYMQQNLQERGYIVVPFDTKADIYIINTCSVTNEVCTLPVFRPLIGFDKMEIVDISEKIGTYETSILPYEDCCTIFVAKHPVTKPNLNIIKRHEENLKEKIDELVQQALDSDVVEIVKVD